MGSHLHRLNRLGHGCKCRHQNNSCRSVLIAYFLKKLGAGEARHLYICDDQIRLVRIEIIQGLHGGLCLANPVGEV
jgi:hypothetical protein